MLLSSLSSLVTSNGTPLSLKFINISSGYILHNTSTGNGFWFTYLIFIIVSSVVNPRILAVLFGNPTSLAKLINVSERLTASFELD